MGRDTKNGEAVERGEWEVSEKEREKILFIKNQNNIFKINETVMSFANHVLCIYVDSMNTDLYVFTS